MKSLPLRPLYLLLGVYSLFPSLSLSPFFYPCECVDVLPWVCPFKESVRGCMCVNGLMLLSTTVSLIVCVYLESVQNGKKIYLFIVFHCMRMRDQDRKRETESVCVCVFVSTYICVCACSGCVSL